MSQRTMNNLIRWGIPVALSLALLVTSIWAAARAKEADDYEIVVQNGYTRAYNELAGTMEEMSVTLGKLQAVNAPNQTVLLLDEVWRLSGSAVSLMSQIPQSHMDSEALNRLVVQLGDYAHSLTNKALRGVSASEEDREQLDALYAISKGIAADMNARLLSGDIPKAELSFDEYYNGSGVSQMATASDGASAGQNAPQEERDYKEQEGIEAFPTLIYDGPFSESTEKMTPKGLSGGAVSEEQAKEIAQRATGLEMTSQGLSNGKIKSYEFTGGEGKQSVDVSITAQGGAILSIMGSATSELEGVPPKSETERYRDTALHYLRDMGYANMQATYAQYYGGCALINCAATQNGVILYNDLIKVWVDREDLHIVGMDARNYLFSHTKRTLKAPAISEAEAEGMLSGRLKVENRALALIPLTPESECLCYEFKCKLDEDSYILYINAESGEEEKIYRIIDSEDGELVL